MLSKIYFYFKDKSESIEEEVFELVKQKQLDECKSPRLFNLNLIVQNTMLVLFEVLADIFKFIIILSADSGHGFNTIFRQRELKSCPYSYQSYRSTQKRIRMFSIGGIMAMIAVAVISSLATNLLFGPKSPTQAASLGWTQVDWVNESSSTLSFADNANWSDYSAKSSSVDLVNGGGSLALKLATSSFVQSTSSDFVAGTSIGSVVIGTVSVLNSSPAEWRKMAVDKDGAIYAANAGDNTVVKHDQQGNILGVISVGGRPHGLTVDNDLNIYIGDYDAAQIRKYSPDGTLLAQTTTGSGSGDGQFINGPFALKVDYQGNIWATDMVHGRVQKFSSALEYLSRIDTGVGMYGFETDSLGNVYIGDNSGFKVTKYAQDGTFLANIGSQGSGEGQFLGEIADLAIDKNDNIYVYDSSGVISEFDNQGVFLNRVDLTKTNIVITGSVQGIIVDAQGNLYAAQRGSTVLKVVSTFSVPNYTSAVIDLNKKTYDGIVSFAIDEAVSPYATMTVFAGDTLVPDQTWASTTNFVSGSGLGDLKGHRYYQYKVEFSTTTGLTLPGINDFNLEYSYYPGQKKVLNTTAGLINYWKMSGDWLDSIGGNNANPSYQQSTQFVADINGNLAGNFTNAGWYGDAAEVAPVINSKTNWTIEGWIKSSTGNGTIYYEGNPWTTFAFWVDPATHELNAAMWNLDHPNGWMDTAKSNIAISTNEWHHVVASLEGGGGPGIGTIRFYIDGVFASSAPGQVAYHPNSYYATIGNQYLRWWGSPSPFDGQIDKLAIFDRALSASEVADHFNEGRSEPTTGEYESLASSWYDTGSTDSYFTGLSWKENPALPTGTAVKFQVRSSSASTSSELSSQTDGLVSLWRLDNNWQDSVGGNDLSVVNAVFGTPKYGLAAGSFSGDAYAKTSAGAIGVPSGSESRTISMWIYREPGDLQNGLGVVTMMGEATPGKALLVGVDNDLSVYISGWAADIKTVEKINNNEWTNVAVSYQEGMSIEAGIKVYINGQLASTYNYYNDTTIPINSDPSKPFIIGSPGPGLETYNFKGLIDDVAIYNKVLTVDEILSNFNNAGLIVYNTRFVGPDGTSNTYFSSADIDNCDPKNTETGDVNCRYAPSNGVGLNNRWLQYRIYLDSDGDDTPVLDQVTLKYVVNKKPEFDQAFGVNGIELEEETLAAGADAGRITLRYRVRDTDTSLGDASPGFISPTFEYYDPISQNWVPIPMDYFKPGDLDNKAVQDDAYTTHSASLLASSLNYSTHDFYGNLRIRVKLNDNELVNNTGQAEAETFYDGSAPTSNLQPRQNFRQFLNHEFFVQKDNTDFLVDRFTGEHATATDAVYGERIFHRNFRPHLIFNGTSTKVELPPLVDLSKDQPFSIYWTTYMDFQDGGCRPMLSTVGTPDNITVCVDSQDNVNNVVHLIGSGMDYWGSMPISGDNRYTFHLIYDGTNIRLYFNDVLQVNQPFNYPFGQEGVAWTLGYSDSNDHYFNGKIGYVASWHKAMPITFVSSNYSYFDVFSADGPRVVPKIEEDILRIGIIDHNNISYNISNTSHEAPDGLNELSGIWQDTASSSFKAELPWKFTDNASRDIYVSARDVYGNLDQEVISIPYAPTKIDLKDLSNVKDSQYREYISWQVSDLSTLNYADNGQFMDYIIYRSTDGVGYAPIAYVDNRLQNYYLDEGLEKGKKYYYRVSVKLYNDIESEKTTVVSDKADGQGGTDFTAPAISSTSVEAADSTWARISWQTDELANSVVEYSEKSANTYASTTAVISMVTDHEVVITGLRPDTDYIFRVKSTDPLNNEGEDDNNSKGFEFTTKDGPSITGVSTVHASNYSAMIAWNTSDVAQGSVIYALNQSFNAPITVNESAAAVSHEVELTGLTPGETYYYKITAKNASGVESLSDNEGRFYQFTAANDMEPPVITQVTADPKTGVETMIDWRTNEPATSRVYYGIESGAYIASTSLNTDPVTVHVMELYGLTPQQQYYYIVVSSDSSGNTSTSSERSFVSIEPVVVESAVKARESAAATKAKSEMTSGVTVINKTDTTAPNLSKIKVDKISGNSATISWLSDEVADSFVEYGTTDKYGEIYGSFENKTEHKVRLNHLLANAAYHFRVAGKDANGNLAKSDDQTFKTAKAGSAAEQAVEEIISGNQDKGDLVSKTPEEKNKLVSQAIERAVSLLNQFSGDVTLGTLESSMMTQYDALNKLAILVPAPVLSAEPAVNVSANSASIQWQTNKEATSFVAYGPAEIYDLQKNPNGYNQIVGKPDSYTQDHQVILTGLKPQTVYHYQVKSKAKIGAEAASRDFTFKTKEESLEITYYSLDRLSPTSASLKWVTNMPADSGLSYIPYRANKLSVEEEKTLADKHMSTAHELVINDFETGVIYQIEAQSTDAKGKRITKQIPAFSTTKDDLPPEITQVQTESMISQAKDAKVQTIITWMTNEPTLCQLTYDKGVISNDKIELRNKVMIESGYNRKHTAVITNFEPGTVYSLQISATDSGGNTSKSPVRTIITPRQKETVFDLIVNNFKETFGWVDKIKGLGN